MTTWSEAELSRLKDLTGAGLPAAAIACRLNAEFDNARSRNSVIGKIIRGKGAFGRLVPRGVPAKAPRPAAPKPRRARVLPSELPRPEIQPVSLPCESHSLPATLPVAYLDAVFADRCLHFVGDPFGPSGPDMPVCGAERAAGVLETRYCRRHLAGQYQARAA